VLSFLVLLSERRRWWSLFIFFGSSKAFILLTRRFCIDYAHRIHFRNFYARDNEFTYTSTHLEGTLRKVSGHENSPKSRGVNLSTEKYMYTF
jgi:hypothetical protein